MSSTPSCVIEELPNFDPTAFDKVLGDLLIKHEANPQQMICTVLGFLKRKTNFFKELDPKKRVLEAYREVGGGGGMLSGGFNCNSCLYSGCFINRLISLRENIA